MSNLTREEVEQGYYKWSMIKGNGEGARYVVKVTNSYLSLLDENEQLKKKSIDLYKCIECEGLHSISTMVPSTCDPESAPICRACVKIERQAAVEKELRGENDQLNHKLRVWHSTMKTPEQIEKDERQAAVVELAQIYLNTRAQKSRRELREALAKLKGGDDV